MKNISFQHVNLINYMASYKAREKSGFSMGDFPTMHTTQEKVEAIVHLVESTKIAKWGEIIIFIIINNFWFVDVAHISTIYVLANHIATHGYV